MHHRLEPKQHRFHYNLYMFWLDLDEIGMLAKRLRWMGHNRFNLFNYRDSDHLDIKDFLEKQGIDTRAMRIRVLTNLCTLGYLFNPVSFYFCYDDENLPVCSVVEVGNTYREMKLYYLGPDSWTGDGFHKVVTKHFYVSPFIDLDARFDFDLEIPGEKLSMRVDDYDKTGKRFFISRLYGKRMPLTDGNLLRQFFSIPLITLKVISAIHWQALLLWLKKIPYHKKAASPDLQRDVQRPYKSH